MAIRTRKIAVTDGEARKKAAIYLRISKDPRKDGLAIDRQREDCLEVAEKLGYEVYKIYIDESISATDKSKVRPEYDSMVADRDAGKFDAVICWNLDRFVRRPMQLEQWLDFLDDSKGKFQVYTKDSTFDLNTIDGRAMARVAVLLANAEVERKSERQKRAQQQRAEQGRPPKGTRPMGYSTDGYKIIKHEAAAVKAIFSTFVNGASIRSIAAGLSGQTGPRIPNVPKMPPQASVLQKERLEANEYTAIDADASTPWRPSSVKTILRNPSYAGFSTYAPDSTSKNREETILKDANGNPIMGNWEPIVSIEMWEEAQRILNDIGRNTRGLGTDRKYLGSGVFLCGDCNKPIKAGVGRYRCNHEQADAKIRKENSSLIRKSEPVDELVEGLIRLRLTKPDAIAAILHNDEPRLNEINRLIEIQQGHIKRVEREYATGEARISDLNLTRNLAEAEIEKLNRERIKLTAGDKTKSILMASKPVEAFDKADLSLKRAFISSFLTVKLHHNPRGRRRFNPETVEIKWNEPELSPSQPGRKTNRAATSKPAK